MSYVNKSILRGVNDQSLSFFTTTLGFTTSQLRIDTLTQFQAYIKEARLVNEDGTNLLTYRQGSLDGRLKNLLVGQDVGISGWESFVEINPNGATGVGYIELDLINRKDAEIVNG